MGPADKTLCRNIGDAGRRDKTDREKRMEAKQKRQAEYGCSATCERAEKAKTTALAKERQTRLKHVGLEFNCWFNQSDPCYAALGHKLNLLMLDTHRYELKIQKSINSTENDPVCTIKNDKMKDCDLFNNRPEVTVVNGILIINPVIRADSGTYRLQLSNSEGTEIYKGHLQVIFEGPPVTPIVLGCLAVILIVLVIVAYYIYKKKNRLIPTPNVSDGPECVKKPHREEEQRPEYATINSQNKNKRKGKEEEVHYGEVSFAKSSAQQPHQTQEQCVYAEVQTR